MTRTPFEVLSGPPSEVVRDKAMLLLGFAGAFRRVELTRLLWSDITTTPEGLVVHLATFEDRRGGSGQGCGDPAGQQQPYLPRRGRCCLADQDGTGPRRGCRQRLAHIRIGGPLRPSGYRAHGARNTDLHGQATHPAGRTGRPLGRAQPPRRVHQHRSRPDIPLELIARQSRHANLDSLILYIRNDDPFRRNSALRLGM